jgi:predicted metal-dependent enzyme (double-stranded beta helix superfamily)
LRGKEGQSYCEFLKRWRVVSAPRLAREDVPMKNTGRFRDFVQSFTQFIADVGHEEERVFADGKAFLSELITHDDWLPEQFANPNPERYQQYLLHCDPMERFSVVSFVWAPGQKTPVHDQYPYLWCKYWGR